MANVLVTGGAGFVGSVCCEQLLARGHRVVVIDDLSTGHASAVPGGAVLHKMNFGDGAKVERLLRHTPIDAVFHFAAKALIPESVSNPGLFFSANVGSGITFLEVLRSQGIQKFVFSSSAAVYGSPQSAPIDEDQPKEPINSYGESKLMFERILRWYATAYGWNVFAFRYFNACGATETAGENHDPETHIVPLLLQTAAGEREHFDVYGDDYPTADGTCIRDYVHVSDIASAHLLALDQPHAPGMRIYNIGCGRGYSVKQVVQAAEQVTGKTIATRIMPRRAGDPAVLCAKAERLIRELNWRPENSTLPKIIQSAWTWRQCLVQRSSQPGPELITCPSITARD